MLQSIFYMKSLSNYTEEIPSEKSSKISSFNYLNALKPFVYSLSFLLLPFLFTSAHYGGRIETGATKEKLRQEIFADSKLKDSIKIPLQMFKVGALEFGDFLYELKEKPLLKR